MTAQLTEKKEELVDRVELFRETHVRTGTFMSQAAEDVHSQPTPEGSQPLSVDEIYNQVVGSCDWGRKGSVWEPETDWLGSKTRDFVKGKTTRTSCTEGRGFIDGDAMRLTTCYGRRGLMKMVWKQMISTWRSLDFACDVYRLQWMIDGGVGGSQRLCLQRSDSR
ncbi:CACTA en-spm transposon protein [Cucumis melo var. makuwa]|uniref:CACTA en-spm transposon protein n=1 Tax=Cucumis melo var. makuwa TaxID=1194695 RepID=A0A5D3DWS0_CUCMM|nr:CACTA en-spm transposon protein [Cucumis melo var. makuwa]